MSSETLCLSDALSCVSSHSVSFGVFTSIFQIFLIEFMRMSDTFEQFAAIACILQEFDSKVVCSSAHHGDNC
jgi:hypothetical protein